MKWYRVGKRTGRQIFRFLFFLLIGYLFGSSVIGDLRNFSEFGISLDESCIKESLSHSRSYQPRPRYTTIYIGILFTRVLESNGVDALKEQLRVLKDYSSGLFTSVRQSGTFENVARKYGVDIIHLDSNQPFATQTKTGYNMIKVFLREKFASYDWFVLLGENSLVSSDGLHQFLSRRNCDAPHYIGRTSWNSKMVLQTNIGYCMAKPGFILSVGLLHEIGRYIHECLDMSYSHRFDLELGRCIKKFIGIDCTDLGHNENRDEVIPVMNIEKANFYSNPHHSFLQQRLGLLQQEIASVISRIIEMEDEIKGALYEERGKRLDMREINSRSDLIWDFVDWTSSSNPHHQELRPSHPNLRKQIYADLQKVMTKISKSNSILRRMTIDEFSVLKSSYVIKPLTSADFKPKIRIAGELHNKPVAIRLKNIHFRRQFPATYTFFSEDVNLMHHSFLNLPPSRLRSERINFIVPLNGRIDYFKKFVNNFMTEFCNEDENVSITVVYFPTKISSAIYDPTIDVKISPLQSDELSKVKAELKNIKPFCPHQNIIVVDDGKTFSRGLALQIGTERTHNEDSVDELLFFCDVSVVLKRDVAYNIRENTVRGLQVYYPILFDPYDPSQTHRTDEKFNVYDWKDQFTLDETSGSWGAASSYSILSIYKSDFMSTEGFDLSRYGRGIEEEKFCDAVIRKARLNVFRSNEPYMFSTYCKETCSTKQQDKCKLRKAECSGSQVCLYKIWVKKHLSTNS